ncbi:hypothetical protein JW968_00605 [Candidatus Woesearchaeota archaeon]|nr:hypothetical protein [Candidatus Woesearchaeota archaeon]
MKFKELVKRSFSKVRAEIETFKGSMNEWIIFLDGGQRDLSLRVRAMENKIEELELLLKESGIIQSK